jgi:S-adenosylmethionine:tRNA ribosyltransferase-isomerase
MDISQFDYHLPDSLIAQFPSESRSDSRLLVVGEGDEYRDIRFRDIGEVLRPGDLLVVNDTRVLPARVTGRKPSGGKVEIMLERMVDEHHALVLLRSNKPLRNGQELLAGDCTLSVCGRQGQFFKLKFPDDRDAKSFFERWGSVPLPPYISRAPGELDSQRYQTVYSASSGAVAAPTAGLHFDQQLIDRLGEYGVGWGAITLHVGAGTFQPVRCENVRDHQMHHEMIRVGQEACEKIARTRMAGGRIVAVGTTVVRALESAAQAGSLVPGTLDTNLFILPGYKFNVVDALITNFHLPKSTLLMMVSAFAGYERIMDAYQFAIENKFRFYSYGDAMFLERKK